MVLGVSRYVSGCNACYQMFVADVLNFLCFFSDGLRLNITEAGSCNFR